MDHTNEQLDQELAAMVADAVSLPGVSDVVAVFGSLDKFAGVRVEETRVVTSYATDTEAPTLIAR